MFRHIFEEIIVGFFGELLGWVLTGTIALAVVGLGLLGWGLSRRGRLSRVETVPVRTAAEAAALPPGSVAAVTGTATVGPAGVLTAPVTGRPCVWHRVEVEITRKSGKTEKVVDAQSGEFFAVADGLSTTLVHASGDPDDVDAPKPFEETVKGKNNPDLVAMDPDASRNKRITQRVVKEWIIPVGNPVYVLAETAPHPQHGVVLRKPEDGPYLVAARSREALSARFRRHAAIGLATGPLSLAGAVALYVLG